MWRQFWQLLPFIRVQKAILWGFYRFLLPFIGQKGGFIGVYLRV